MSDQSVQVHHLPAVTMFETELSEEMVTTLNDYLDNLLEDQSRKSHAGTLVGQIHRGEQLTMDHEVEELQEFRHYICQMGADYITTFSQTTGAKLKPKYVDIDELWSVHSFEGDYNPVHDHGTKTLMGISTTCWTKVPEQIGKLGDSS